MNPQIGMCNADGYPWYIARPGYALAGAKEGAVIGRIGDKVFLVGKYVKSPAGASGRLYLCPNDDLYQQYGKGLTDNYGQITMEITSVLTTS